MIKQQDTGTTMPRRRGGRGRRRALMLSAGTLAMVCAQPALAQVLPTGGVVTIGDATIGSTGPGNVTVTQNSDRVLIDWTSFDIGSGGSVHFDMNATDIAVNRDNAGDPSEIYGSLTGDGMIMILNPNGVLFGAGANVNVGSLVATSASLTDVSSNLLSFTGASGAVTVAAGANITVADAGLAAFVAPAVANNGIITATGGHVFLGGAEGFTLDLANDGLLELTVSAASPLVQNHGDIFAAGGRIQMSAAAASALVGAVINTSGVLSVASASSDNGVIVLEAAGNAIEVSADLAVEGDIEFNARRVFGAGDVDVDDGALTLNIDPDGADTTAETLIADALGVIGSVEGGTTLNLAAGDYAAGAIINTADVTVNGGGVARIIADQNGQNGLTVGGNGDGAVIQGLHFLGQADTSYNGFAWGSTITRGVVLMNGAQNVTVTDNVITGVRNGILIDGRNDGSIITDNIIDNTKSAISVQYTDGSTLTLTGNAEGQFGNEWGINVHLNGVWNGLTITPSAGSLGANPSAAAQQHLLDLSNANSGMSVYNQAYSASNRTHVHVDANGSPAGQGAAPTPISTVHGGVAAVVNGGHVYVANGVYNFAGARLVINKSLTLTGESEEGVILDGRSVGSGLGTVLVSADNVSLSNFTLYGADSGANNYGIKVQPNPAGYNRDQRLYNFSISDVTVRGSTRAELDLNGVVGATITNFTADGRRVGDDSHESGGAGVQITDSADITLTGVTTLGNAWGSVAIYQSNVAGAYNGLTTNINIDARENSFSELLGVFVQSYSTLHPRIGQLNLTGFDYAVRNTGHRANGDQFTFFRTDLADATAFARALGAAETSSIEGWSGTDYTNIFTVVNGLTIGAAIRDIRDGGFINVGAGTYGGFATAFGGPAGLTITGADGAVINGAGVTGRIIDLRADGTTLSGFTIQGDGGGVAVSVSGRGVTVADNTITDVLTGVQTTTQYAAGNAVITGNTISADYGISLQNTGNTVSGNIVNAAIEGAGLLRSANTFSGNTFNIAAGGDALNYYGSATYAGLVAAGNTVSIEGGGLQGAVDLAGAAGSVDAGAATYDETITIRHGLTLAGAGMDQTHLTGGINLSNTAFSDLTLRGFTLSGDGGGNALVRNGRVTNLTIDGVRFDGANVAGRHGFAGGQFGGAISITNSEFLDIRGWSAFDTSTGGTATAITSVVFSDNLLDGTVGHVTFRQATPTADVLISGNTVRNVGDTTDLSSGIFKVFGAATVDFVGNEITGIGASPTRFTGGVNDGAALIVRGVGTLNITDNIFTDNQQAFLVGAGNALPTVTTITGNTFNNNAYDIFLPASTGGVITFGAGNNFITGADTVAHLTWAGAAGLDMTGVMFDGALGSDMSLAELFALEDRIHHGIDQAGVGLVRVVDGHLFVTEGSGVDAALRALGLAVSGDTLNLSAGTHTLTNTLFIQDDRISVVGQGQGQTIIDASGHGAYGIRVHGDHVSLGGFTLNGSAAATSATYGVKVEAASGSGPSGRNTGFSITDVTISGSRKTGLDLNSVLDALIDGVTVTDVMAGNGISITDSAGVMIRNSTTSGNAWGGLALYQRNNHSDQQLTDIVIEGSNSFGEDTPVYLQVYNSALHAAGDLTVEGFDFVVGNDALDGGVSSYLFFDRSLQDAIDRGVNLANASESIVGGWTGAGADGHLYVGFGDLVGGGRGALSIQRAFDASGDGDTINIAAGDYGQSAILDETRTVVFDAAGVGLAALTLTTAAAGSGLSGQLTATGAIDLQGDIVLNDNLGLTGASVSLAGVEGSSVNGQTLSIEADAISIASAGVTTALDSLLLFGDATLTGDAYNAAGFMTTGATTLANDVSISVDGSLVMGAVDGAYALSISAGSATLGQAGAVDALASLQIAASTITTAGAATAGGQSYAGALTLTGDYASGGAFSVNGATTLGGDVGIMTWDGDVMLGLIDGAHGLTIAAGSGDVALGPVGSAVAVDDLVVSGGVVTTAGAASTGDQSWSGDQVRLSGAFTTAGGDFTVSGPARLNGTTTIVTSGGDAVLGSVDGATPGGQAFSVNAGTGSVELGALGALARLGATVVRADSTVLTGDTYAANSLSFMGAGADATVRLTALLTTFNTVRSAGQAGAISIAPHLIGTADGQQGVVFLAGTGGSAGDGDITLGDVGSDDLRLGLMTATGGDFTAQTVLLAGDFTSTLSGDQVFSDDTLDTLGDVNATVAGNERGPIIAGGSVNLNVGGASNGAITAGGPVTVTSGGDTNRAITAAGAVVLTSTGGSVGGSVQADGPVTVNSAGTITGAYASGGDIILNAAQPVSVQVNGGVIQVNAPGGIIGGVFSEIATDARGTFVINGQTVVGAGNADARQVLVDGFIAPVGGVVGPTGVIQLPIGLALALVSPAGDGAGQRPAVLVNNVDRLGELLRRGYTAIVIQIDESGLLIEEELILADTDQPQAAGLH